MEQTHADNKALDSILSEETSSNHSCTQPTKFSQALREQALKSLKPKTESEEKDGE